jgi:hypothetical protein
LFANVFLNDYFAGAGTTVAAGAGTTVATGAGAATVGAGAGSSAFLHPTTERDREATNNIATNIANIFFIIGKPPFKDLIKVVLI